ncbi:hypothetical protein FOMPIDRAFT_1109648 [Fomitopsis schrenkii]|uniref:CHCH domain-containing protein n=1 Tax=Fomitopsis schrenkii TaxID=2126942 RepID=S8FXN4_FOMSC|nr:hypothetical protein FOMPIDRAFT_1109648 [Fomitopsis schrenkii]
MQIKKLKVRPRKMKNMTTCGPALATMLGCMAANGDVHTMGPCQEAAQALFQCMRTTPMGKTKPRNTINYHLMRLNKYLK